MDKLPLIENNVTQPKGGQSLAMQARQSQIITIRIPGFVLIPARDTYQYDKNSFDVRLRNPTVSGEAVFFYNLSEIQSGDKIFQLDLVSRRKDNSGSYLITATLGQIQPDGTNNATVLTVNSTSNGTTVTDSVTSDVKIANTSVLNYYILVHLDDIVAPVNSGDVVVTAVHVHINRPAL